MGQVQIILREDVGSLGKAGDVVSVKPGYARNFLLAQGKAMLATQSRVRLLEHQQRMINDKLVKERKDLEVLKQRLESTRLEFSAQAGEEGKLFGSVTVQQLAEQLAEKGFEVDRRKLTLDEPIKTLGEHTVAIRLGHERVAEVVVVVTASE